MSKETVSVAISNGDSANPIQASVVETGVALINGMVVTNPDGTTVGSGVIRDLITPTFSATSDVYVFSLGGVTQETITLNYTDATKAVLSTVVKS